MQILVFGASGKTGLEFVRQALQRGHSITAFTREASKVHHLSSAIRVIEGNVRDRDAVLASVQDHDAVLSFLGVGRPLRSDADVIAGVRHIVGAMETLGIRRLIYLSFIGVAESRAAVGLVLRVVAPIALRHEIADHEAKEAIVRQSGLDWTIVRPPRLTNGPVTGRYRAGEDISTRIPVPSVSRADVAHFILRELDESHYVRRCPRLLH